MNENLSFKNIFKRETKLASYIIICLTIVVLSLSYAMFFRVNGNSENQVVEAGDLVFTYENSSQTITNTNSNECFMPMSGEETSLYLGTCDYKLSVQNTGSLKGAYTLRLVANEDNTIDASYLKVVLRKQVGETLEIVAGYENGKLVSELTGGILIQDEEMETGSTVVYSIFLYVAEDSLSGLESSVVDGIVASKISYSIEGTGLVHESQELGSYQETILNGAYPVLEEPLMAVTIEEDGTVKRADLDSKWYSYEEKVWANAIILKDESTNNNYAVGATIPEEVIESYFVWIPRYKYKIFDDGNYTTLGTIEEAEQEIEIEFENKDTAISSGTTVGSWLSHPAFTAFDSNGMWVGKFEPSRNGGSEDNIRNGDAVQIKPNVASWRGIQVANAFYTSYDYKRNLESHMMKNTEWGAVAYLQHSKYGSQTSVRINNNSSYITGYQANNEPTCGYTATNEECNRYCNDGSCNVAYPNSILASTTNNISGIFDMSGGAWEYVMGIILDQNGKPMSGRNSLYNSGFNGTFGCPTCDSDTSGLTSLTSGYEWPEKKYYDTYANSTSNQQYIRRILGDATGEIGPFETKTYLTQTRQIGSWYADYARFVHSSDPWFIRGGAYSGGLDAGAFAFASENGRLGFWVSFRVVLTP